MDISDSNQFFLMTTNLFIGNDFFFMGLHDIVIICLIRNYELWKSDKIRHTWNDLILIL